MTEPGLTPDRILDAAEDVLRRFGPAKTTVVDVARALDVSHGAIYRHFPSKAALQDAVAQRWLYRVEAPLATIAAEDGPAADRLDRWLEALVGVKRRKMQDDPELFATYHALVEAAREVIDEHLAVMVGHLTEIVRDGVEQGAFAVSDPAAAARAVLSATARFHHPAHAAEWADPAIDADFDNVRRLIAAGLTAGG